MLLRRRTSRASALVALLALIACDDPIRPQDVAGTYVLRTVRGQPLPAVLWETDHTQLRVLADTLRLNADGTGSEAWLLEFTGQHASESGRSESALRFEVRDGRLEGSYLSVLAVIQLLRGEFTPSGLRLDVAKHAEGPLEFIRADR